jgi:hypothetical protein
MIGVAVRVAAVLIGAYTLYVAFFASIFRIDAMYEFRAILYLDIRIGFWLGMSFLLWRVPTPVGATWRRHVVSAIGTALIWAVVTGGLWQTHLEQVHIRGQYPMEKLIDEYLWPALLE